MPYHRHPYMHHVPRVGGYLPRVGGYLPRVGADCGPLAMQLSAPSLQQIAPGAAYAAVADGYQQAATDVARMAWQSTMEVPTPRTRVALFLPASADDIALGAFSLQVIPTTTFQAEEFTVAANAADFEISQITIGIKPLFAGGGVISAAQFAPNSLASRACRGTVAAGTPIVITGRCLVQGSNFRGSFSGAGLVEG